MDVRHRYGHTMRGKDGGGRGVDDAFAQRFLPGRYALTFRLGVIRDEPARARRIAQIVAMLQRGETIHPQARRPPASA